MNEYPEDFPGYLKWVEDLISQQRNRIAYLERGIAERDSLIASLEKLIEKYEILRTYK